MKKIFFIFLCFYTTLSSEKITLPVSYFLDISNYEWKGPAEIKIQNEKIIEISLVNKNSDEVYYITPTFCDAQVTLSLNAIGGANNKKDIYEILKSYFEHGITYILSTFDPPWVKNYYYELKKKNKNLPQVFFSDRAILFPTKEYGELPSEIYFTNENFEEIKKEIRKQQKGFLPILIINREFLNNPLYFTSEHLYSLKQISRNHILTVGTFASKQSVLDSLRAEIEYLQHPISSEWSIKQEHKNKLKLMPLLNVYKNLFLLQNQKIEEEWKNLNLISKYFNKKIYEKARESFHQNLEQNETVPFANYIQFITENLNIQSNLILGSGAGNLYSFHAISSLIELNLFREAMQSNLFLKSGIENSCRYLGMNDDRAIHIGNSTNLILFRKNPTKSLENLFSIEKVILMDKNR